jgi:ABC-2 type transport system permease protein
MLWYKAWLETRSRFLVSLIGMVALCSYWVSHENGLSAGRLEWYYHVLHTGHSLLAAMWVLAVILLMMGGLLREKAVGTAPFTLALPVSRAHLLRVRILSGLAQAMALAVVPWGAMFLVAVATGKANSVSQAFFHVILLAGGGVVFFAIALLVSSLVEGEYTAPALSFGIMFADIAAFGEGPMRAISPWNFIVGGEYFDRASAQLVGPLPWGHFAANVLMAILLTAVSIRAIQRTEF